MSYLNRKLTKQESNIQIFDVLKMEKFDNDLCIILEVNSSTFKIFITIKVGYKSIDITKKQNLISIA